MTTQPPILNWICNVYCMAYFICGNVGKTVIPHYHVPYNSALENNDKVVNKPKFTSLTSQTAVYCVIITSNDLQNSQELLPGILGPVDTWSPLFSDRV